MIVLSEEFQKFVLKTGRIMERALWETSDIYADYIGGGDADDAAYVEINSFNFICLNDMKILLFFPI